MLGVDDVDRKLLELLASDGRASYADLGAAVSLSATAVKRRVDRLVAHGVIRGFGAVVDPFALGWTTEAYVEVYCRGSVEPAHLRASLERHPEVVSACTVSGHADALVHLLAADVRHLEAAIEAIRSDSSIDHTRSAIVLSRLVDRPRAETSRDPDR